MSFKFEGVCPVINIPFLESGEIDFDGIKSVVDYTLLQGVKSLCVFAFNSEPHKMNTEEKIRVIKYFLKAVDRRAETLVGLIENSVSGVIELGLAAREAGADGAILYPPALSPPSGDELLEYFKAIADAVKIDVMIQDNPRSTGVNMSLEFLVEAYKKIESFKYLKVECPIPIRKMKQIISLTDNGLKCYSGNGGIFAVDAFRSGAWGIMPGVTLAGRFTRLYELLKSGDEETARCLFEKLLPVTWYEDQSLEFYIASEKLILEKYGIIAGSTCRKPCCSLSDEEKAELFNLFERAKR